MKRRTFLKHSCTACIAATGLAALMPSCKPGQFVQGRLNNDGVLLDVDDFKIRSGAGQSYRLYVVVRNDHLKFPICVYRFSETDYSALWMECMHQGAEVNVVGSYLQCPAHGSEYDSRGRVTNGPAESNLRAFPVTVHNDQLFIDLR
ncbi:MAG TPA: Rieske 2Fe-2S domain-containing protein, partial [Chitinophagaceae bacterium]|nr:Rieske 2Fe-2S domain-containing protein [Chitinophagaceae bacterium]